MGKQNIDIQPEYSNLSCDAPAGKKLDYCYLSDAYCKQVLGDKLILACILKSCVSEFKDCHVNDIENKYIEGEPEIGTMGVHPETTNSSKGGRIFGISNENTSDSEGTVKFDIRFFAYTPSKERVKLIINIEAQNDFYPGYPFIKRAIYYGCRNISAQYGSEFEKAEYSNIKKVYSIWICFDHPIGRRNTITSYQISEKHEVGSVCEVKAHYDLMCIVMICLGTEMDERYTGILKFLDVWMSRLSLDKKSSVLKSEFHADLPERLSQKERHMCNYSEFVKNCGFKEGKAEGIKEGKAEGIKEGKAEGIKEGRAEGIKEGRAEGKAEGIASLMFKKHMTLEDACDMLSIPKCDWESYRPLVKQIEAHLNIP